MRTLLLFAKYIATEEKSEFIEMLHIQCASEILPLRKKLSGDMIAKANVVKNMLLEEYDEVMATKCAVLVEKHKASATHQIIKKMSQQPQKNYAENTQSFLNGCLKKDISIDGELVDKLFSIPVNYIVKNDEKSLPIVLKTFLKLKQNLSLEILGQAHAIEEIVDQLTYSFWSNVTNKPKAVFFFLGPPATGKTFLAERLSHHLDMYAFLSLDMTQFRGENEGFGLTGLRKGYDDACEGTLTKFVKENRRSIIVFDEFEKAHSKTQLNLLGMLSTGFITDAYTEKKVDFRESIVIFTSNLGSQIYDNKSYTELLNNSQEQIRSNLLHNIAKETKIERDYEVKAIQPELLSRLSQGSVLLFNRLPFNHLITIAQTQVEKDFERFSNISQIKIDSPNKELIQLLTLSFAPVFDLREIRSRASLKLVDAITDYLADHPNTELNAITFKIATHDIDLTDLVLLQRTLSLKHQTLSFSTSVKRMSSTLVVTIENIELRKLTLSSDFDSSGGLVIDIPETSFDDISGHEFIKSRLIETASLYKNRSQLHELGVSPPSGILLYGPPGTGKTMLAKAFANTANLPIITCNGADLFSESFIRTVFQRARDYAPCIIFIDEIDALPSRGTMNAHGDALINRLLTEIDGFSTSEQEVLIIAATNFKEKLDPALIRSGRIDLHFMVPHLDKGARRWFIEQQLKHPKYANDINIDDIITISAGMSGADLQKVHREVLLRTIRENLEYVTQALLIEEINILKYGPKHPEKSGQNILAETAYHEAAHAVISKILVPSRIIEQITVVAHQNSLGMVSYDRDQHLDYTKDLLFSMTCVALAGRAAQVKKFGNAGLDSGASQDLKQASSLAWTAIAELGMHEKAYNLDISSLRKISEHNLFQQQLETLLAEWIENATKKTTILIEEHWDKIEQVAQKLLEDEVIGETTLLKIINTPNQPNRMC